jgi:hypothetical protein
LLAPNGFVDHFGKPWKVTFLVPTLRVGTQPVDALRPDLRRGASW